MSKSAKRYQRNSNIDKHDQRVQRGTEMIRTDREVSREDYRLGWFNPTQAQKKIIQSMREKECTLVDAPSGCVDRDTEFLSQNGWKKISDYVKGDLVMQVSQNGLNANLVEPIYYIKEPCDTFYTIKTERGIDQWLSLDHNVAYSVRKKDKLNKISVEELIKFHDKNVCGFEGTISTTYNYSGKSLGLSENMLRLYVAIKADGSFSNENTKLCHFNLKKERKIERLKRLLICVGTDYKLTKSESSGYTLISFYAKNCSKSYKDWMFCSKDDAEIIFDEQKYWDGNFETKGNRLPCFSTSSKDDADFMQYIGNVCGYRSSISVTDRVGETYKDGSYERKSLEYRVLFTKQTNIRLLGCNDGVKSYFKQEKSVDGIKYCFTVPSGFLVLRRNNQVFITGNCGKSTTVIHQALNWLKNGDYRKIIFIKSPSTLSMDEVGFLGTNEAKFDFPLMAMRSIFESFMSKEKLEMEEKRGVIEFMFPLWLGGQTFSNALVLVDEMQWFDPATVKLVLERCDSTCKVVCMFDGKQRYTTKWRKDGSQFLVDKVTTLNSDNSRTVKEPLFGYVKLTHNENRRGALSKRITEMFDDLDFDRG